MTLQTLYIAATPPPTTSYVDLCAHGMSVIYIEYMAASHVVTVHVLHNEIIFCNTLFSVLHIVTVCVLSSAWCVS